MSIHLVGGGWSPEGDPRISGAFLAEAASRAAGAGRMIPRLGVLMVVEEEEPGDDSGGGSGDDYVARFAGAFEKVAACQPVVTSIVEGARFDSSVLTDVDGLVIGGGLTPAYLVAVEPIMEEIRLLVADGLPYLGYSAGAMIAADRAIIGGWLVEGIPVCPEETSEDLDELTVGEGLGLVDLAIDVHAAQRGTLGRLVAATEAALVEGGVAIDEATVLIVSDDGLRVDGAGNVWRVLDDPAGVIVGTLDA